MVFSSFKHSSASDTPRSRLTWDTNAAGSVDDEWLATTCPDALLVSIAATVQMLGFIQTHANADSGCKPAAWLPLRQADALAQGLEARVGAQGVEERVHFDIREAEIVIGIGFL